MVVKVAYPCDVTSRPRKTVNQPNSNSVPCNHYNGNRLGSALGNHSRGRTKSNEHVNLEIYEIGYKGGEAIRLTFSVAVVNDDVLSLYVTKLTQPLPKCLDIC